MSLHKAFIGMGSNIGDGPTTLKSACDSLKDSRDIFSVRCSPLYLSAPVGPDGQDDYTNAVAMITTSLSPEMLLDRLQFIESEHGRERTEKWGPRTLDLDLLLYDQRTIDTRRLIVPHPHMIERNFVLRPLLDLEPGLRLPDGASLAKQAASIGDEGLRKLGPLPL